MTCLGLSQQDTWSIKTHKLHKMLKYKHTVSPKGIIPRYSLLAQEPAWAACPGSFLEVQALAQTPHYQDPRGLEWTLWVEMR